jgi:acyl carrier protein
MLRDKRWRAPKDTGFCSTNCRINDVGIHVHQLERGFHNYAAPLSWDIRLGVTSRSDAAEELREPVGGAYVRSILSELKYTPRDRSRGKIQESAVVLRQGPAGQPMLCAYFVSSGRVNVAELRDHLAQRLPDYMIPKHLIRVDEIPISTNGKVDFAKLPLPATHEEPPASRAGSEIETRLRRLWREVLGVESIAPDDDFFDLGGDSLLATILVSLIEAELGRMTSVADIFGHPSIREMVRHLESGTQGGPECTPQSGAY